VRNKTAEVFDLYADKYDQWFETVEGKMLFSSEVEAVQLHMNTIERPFLEIGVGTGRFAEALGIDFGIDPSHRALKMASHRGINVKEGKGENLPFTDNSFGAVFLLFTLCFVDEPKIVVSEAKRVLKHGGRLIAGIINKESLWGRLYSKKKDEGHPLYSYAHFYSITEIYQLLAQTGFKSLEYSSTLCQPPSDNLCHVTAIKKLIPCAGFICVSGRKNE